MFEKLFRFRHALDPHRTGPLADERRRFLCHRAEQGFGRPSLRRQAYYLLAVARYLRLDDRPGERITLAEIRRQAARWARRSQQGLKGRRSSRQEFVRFACLWLRFLGRLELPAAPVSRFAEPIAAFAQFLLRDRGLSPVTVRGRCDVAARLLDRLAVRSLRDITLDDIDRALVEQLTHGRYARVTIHGWACDLRSFFSYAEANGLCRAGLAAGIRGPRTYSQDGIPVGLGWDDVQRLLAQPGGDRPKDLRDRAILLLLAGYGFRSGEVRGLRLGDFDWHNEVLTVFRGKTRAVHTYPLARPIGEAVLRYLRGGRPRSTLREVFLTVRPPFRPLGHGAVASMVSRRLQALGLSLPRFGAHILRHACATHLLGEGLSLKEIGDHLGHRHPDSTRIYAKVNLPALRQVADFDLGGVL